MRTLKQFVADEWNGLSEGLAGDHREAVAKRQAAWAPYGGASRYYLSGALKAFIILFVAVALGLATAMAIKALSPASEGGEVWFASSLAWLVPVGIASGAGRGQPLGTRDIGTGTVLRNLFFWAPAAVLAWSWLIIGSIVLVLAGFGLVLLALRYL